MCAAMPPANDTRAGATVIPISATNTSQTFMTNTSTARNDTTGTCSCTSGNDVFYRFTLTQAELVYADTYGTTWDTSLFLQDSTGANLASPGITGGSVCSDDTCGGRQTHIVARLNPGTYYLVLSGCASGAATIHFQHLPVGNGAIAQITPMTGMQSFMGTTGGTGVVNSSCGSGGPENTYWFTTCPTFTSTQFSASTCGTTTWDTSLDQRSATRTPVSVCNDDSCGLQSSVSSTLPAGAGLHTLYVDGFNSMTSGAYTVNVNFGTCPAGQTFCGSTCVDLRTSNTNCGACGRACTGGSTCTAGMCTCPAGQTLCSGTCVDLRTSNTNCGACGTACAAGSTCQASTCRPANNDRASATALTLGTSETTVTGSTANATHDGPTPCDCTGGGNVWYRFTLTQPEVVYVDTAGSNYDTSVFITDMAGTAVANSCNDDAGCTTGGFTSIRQSRAAVLLNAGTYYIAVGGCGSGNFTLHVQHLPRTVGSFFYDTQFTGTGTTSTTLVGTSANTSMCGGTASGEDVRWFVTCGGQQEFFSLCMSDGGSFTRRIGTRNYDPAMYIRSAQTGAEVVCNDDGGTMGGTNCQGTGGDTAQYGSRLNNVVVPRGLNALFVDERVGGSGMQYTLRYTVR
jgi:hypothetical protein